MKRFSWVLIVCLGLLVACSPAEKDTSVLRYKGSSVGDNSAVVNISREVTILEDIDHIELQTKKEPYGIEISYTNTGENNNLNSIEKEVRQQSLYLYYLVDNVDYILFNFNNQSVHSEREMYRDDLAAISQLEKVTEKAINDYIYDTYTR